MMGKAMETAAPDGAMEELPLRLESWPRRLGHLPTALPQPLGNRSLRSRFPQSLGKRSADSAFTTVPTTSVMTTRDLTRCPRKWGSSTTSIQGGTTNTATSSGTEVSPSPLLAIGRLGTSFSWQSKELRGSGTQFCKARQQTQQGGLQLKPTLPGPNLCRALFSHKRRSKMARKARTVVVLVSLIALLVTNSTRADRLATLEGIALDESLAELQAKFKSGLKHDTSDRFRQSESLCGWDTYQLNLDSYSSSKVALIDDKVISIYLESRAHLNTQEVYQLARRFHEAYGQPDYFLCRSSRGLVKNLSTCEGSSDISLVFDSFTSNLKADRKLEIRIFDNGYVVKLTKDYSGHHDGTQECRENALKELAKRRVDKIKIPN